MKKKLMLLCITLIVSMLLMNTAPCPAFAVTMNLPVFLKVNQYFVLYTYPRAPYIDSQNRIMIPLRIFCGDFFGADVDFDNKTKAVIVKFSGKTLKLTIGSKAVEIDGQPAELDTVPVFCNGNVFVPLRALTNAFGINTGWNSQYRYIHLEDERIMKTETFLYMEDTTRAEIADPDAFIPVSASLTPTQKNKGSNTYTDFNFKFKSRNITGHDLPEGKEDIQYYIVYDTGVFTYETPYSWQGRVRPFVEAGGTIEKQKDIGTIAEQKETVSIPSIVHYILYWGRVIQ